MSAVLLTCVCGRNLQLKDGRKRLKKPLKKVLHGHGHVNFHTFV